MPLMILGVFVVAGFLVYYIFSTRTGGEDYEDDTETGYSSANEEDGIKEEDNVIFLPNDLERIKKNRNVKH